MSFIPHLINHDHLHSGTFGAQCANQCQCSANGTALCLHTTGQCFCSPNWYGKTCELNCPFGYVDDVCHTSPVDPDVCICSSDQMICDHIKGTYVLSVAYLGFEITGANFKFHRCFL